MFCIKNHIFFFGLLLVDFIMLTKQNLIKKTFLIYKIFVKKRRAFSKKTRFFIEKTIYITLPQHNLT